ncbi:MAG: RNA-binding transcriptional accessory protein [Christensenellaceae bacterium]|jgi:uncharacterized protein|nr:RNA-binding transcriptional accessory protein [Christensenellaceae bacterium]
MNIPATLANEFSLAPAQVAATVALIEDGNTIPFIARYRKEATGGISDTVLRDLDERLTYLKNLEARKAEVLRLIDEQGKLTPELSAEVEKAEVLQRVEDLYKPYKLKRATRASKARARGLEPLADLIWAQQHTRGSIAGLAAPFVNAEGEVSSAEDAIAGACDILAERIAEDANLITALRNLTRMRGTLVSEAADAEEKTVYEMYYKFSEPLSKIPSHRILAINRGENDKKLKVKVQVDADFFTARIARDVITNQLSIFVPLLQATIADSYKRLIAPSLERELRSELTERAEVDAIKIFAKNTENLLMTPPVGGARVIAIDPGFRTGCKVAVLSETGKLLDYTTIYPTAPKNDVAGTESTLRRLIEKHEINVIVIGNGTASRETEEVVAAFLQRTAPDIRYTIVNEAGASVYSASKLASEEYPDLDVTTRGAMSLGRRLQDPLAELVKIPPKSIGVGQYQHDLNQGLLEKSLTGVVENCVNRVGVDLNTASASLLTYVAGINVAVAKSIVAWREENGSFADRKQLKKVPKLGDKAFGQCAGFLRVSGGKNPLDATSVHPESYAAVKKLLTRMGVKDTEIANGGVADMEERVRAAVGPDWAGLAAELNIGLPTLRDIVGEIKKPARDPREDAPAVVFSREVRDFGDLAVGMELTGTVRNVVDFGAFVDIGVKHDGLVHISRMSDHFVRHPSDVAAVGDTVRVWVISVDKERGKVGLSMVPCSSENNPTLFE